LLLLLVFSRVKLKTFLGAGDKLLTVVVFKLLNHIFIDGVDQVEDLKATLLKTFHEGGSSNSGLGFTSDVVDALLSLLHASDVVLEGDLVFTRLGGGEAEELSDLGAVCGIFVDTKLKVLGELLVEFLVVLSVLLDLSEHLKALLDNVLLHDLEDLVLLESFTRDVKGKIFGVDNTLDEAEPFGNNIFAVVHDENTTHVELDVVLLLLGFKEIEGSAFRQEEKSTELEGAFNVEVLDSKVVFPIVG